MEYQTPQFIEVEDKLVGPFTFKQFVYIAGAGGLCIVFFVYFNIFIAVILSIPVVGLAGALAFYKINGKTLIEMMESGFGYYTSSRLFLWRHEGPTAKQEGMAAAAAQAAADAAATPRSTPKLTQGKLSALAWSLDVQGQQSSDSSNT